jgi:hypothetical protein
MAKAALIDFMLAGLVDDSGEPLAGGKIYTYLAGTTTAKAIYQDSEQAAAHTNPAILDSRGVLAAYGTGSYKFVIKDADDATQYTVDNISFGGTDFTAQKVAATTAGQLEFTISGFSSPNRCHVILNGVVLSRDSYTITTTKVTLDSGYSSMILVGSELEVVET